MNRLKSTRLNESTRPLEISAVGFDGALALFEDAICNVLGESGDRLFHEAFSFLRFYAANSIDGWASKINGQPESALF